MLNATDVRSEGRRPGGGGVLPYISCMGMCRCEECAVKNSLVWDRV